MKHKDDKVLVNFGNHLRSIRKMQDLSQEELAERVGLHRTYIGMIERGEKNITLLNIVKISNALEIPVNELMEFSNGQ
jgi:transcriptional regulator with XRE-family HTH domain